MEERIKRPRIERSAVLLAKSEEPQTMLEAKRRAVNTTRPYVWVFDKKLYIQASEVSFYEANGFKVFGL